MKKLMYCGIWAVALGTALAAVTIPASAQLARPQTALGVTDGNDLLTAVQFRGRGGYRGGYGGYRGYGGGYRYGGWRGPGVGLGIGLATGALIGGALAAPYYYDPSYYYAPAPGAYYGAPDNSVDYCMQRFRSYDPASGTYVGYDGRRHPCP